MVEITRELAEALLEDARDLLAQNEPMRNYARYDTRCKLYESEIAQLQAAIEKEKEE
jgi:hypothetical protein